MSFADRLGRVLPHPLSMRERRKLRLRARRGERLAVIVAGSVVAGAVAVLFAKLCDIATAEHVRLVGYSKALGFLALALSLPRPSG